MTLPELVKAQDRMDVVGRMMNEQLDFKKIRKDYKFHAFKSNIEKMLKES